MQKESYWDYMGRRMREDKMHVGPTKIETELLKRIEELERWRMTFIISFEQGESPVEKIDSNPKQLEMFT